MHKETLIIDGLTTKTNKNGFCVASLHYTADPDKPMTWANELRKTYISDIWQQEMELDFTKASGKRVYPEFKSELHIADLQPIPYHDIWIGWDFGYHHPAVVFAQHDETNDCLNILAEFMGEEVVINRFAEQVLAMSKKLYPGFTFKHAGDPACRQKGDKSERTTADILRSLGIRMNIRPMSVKDGVNTIRNLLLLRPDGSLRFKINKSCETVIDGFLGGYTRNDEDEPVKDNYYEHLFDAMRYMVTNLFNSRTYDVIKPCHIWVKPRKTAVSSVGY